MKAFVVTEEYGGHGVVVFHDHETEARRVGAEELEVDSEEVECNREPAMDKYQGRVPAEVLVKEFGWWWECHHCWKQVHADNDDPPVDRAIFISDEIVYCCQECRDAHLARVQRVNDEFEQFQIAILELFPNLEFTHFEGGWPCLSPSAYFTFPGARFGAGSLRVHRRALVQYVATGDLAAWNKYLEEKPWRDSCQPK